MMATIEYKVAKVARPRLLALSVAAAATGPIVKSRFHDWPINKLRARAKDVAQTFMPNDGSAVVKCEMANMNFRK